MRFMRLLAALFAVTLLAAACGDDDSGSTDATGQPEPAEEDEGPVRTIEAPSAAITVDGDAADWADITGLDLTLEPISDEDASPHDAVLKVAHDDENVYVLLQVDDDFNYNPENGHKSGAAAVEWAIESGAGEHMGAEDEDRDTSLGMVDIWHWELECAAGTEAGGAVNDAGNGDPGNDAGCNLDDEWATVPENREDDNGDGAENSILGVYSHSAAQEDADGTWTFEFSRPLQTGDSQDAQFTVGQDAKMAVAYWDPDETPEGWEDDLHVQSANQGWIVVEFA
ncbi:MAG: hypothetical protein D6683_08240 [Actinomyces sp.]|nr:MAG: hypothetical protein D6683_08240 [Actinomyces sp.]